MSDFACSAVPSERQRHAEAGGANVSGDKRGHVPRGVLLNAGTSIAPTTPPSRPLATGAEAHEKAEPSWGRVLATTIELWLVRHLRAVGLLHAAGEQTPNRLAWRPRHWRRAALILALAITAVAVLISTGVFTETTLPAARTSSPDGTGTHGMTSRAVAQTEAAAWIADQVSSAAIVGCYPAMCAILQAHGVTAGRLLPLGPGSAGPPGADVIVTSASTVSQFAAENSPAMIASFGSGGSRIEVQVIARDGAAAYESALRADLAARKSAGPQLLRNSRIRFSPREATQLRLGEVDSRLLATLAALSTQYRLHVTAFDDASPGAPTLFREVTIASSGGTGGAELGAVLTAVNGQHPPYLPDRAAIIRSASGLATLRIEFAAPSPLGLLTTILEVEPRRAASRTNVIAAAFFVPGIDRARG
jgi:hypothetical protein